MKFRFIEHLGARWLRGWEGGTAMEKKIKIDYERKIITQKIREKDRRIAGKLLAFIVRTLRRIDKAATLSSKMLKVEN